jgi:cell division protein FtsW (lipid II flippase)
LLVGLVMVVGVDQISAAAAGRCTLERQLFYVVLGLSSRWPVSGRALGQVRSTCSARVPLLVRADPGLGHEVNGSRRWIRMVANFSPPRSRAGCS